MEYDQLDYYHPHSYIHAIIKFKDGMIKLIAHDTTMKIPIFNSIYSNNFQYLKSRKIDFKKLNSLEFLMVDKKKI